MRCCCAGGELEMLVLAQASMWGLAVWLFWGLGTPYHMTALLLIAFSYCLGSVQLLATQQRLFIVFTGLVLAPAILRIATDTTQPWHWQLAGILCLLFAIVLVMGRAQRSALDQVIRLKSHSEKLAAQLQVEMGVAESARRAAEAASRAKTQFFAAASHDLRQPLHAMGLFAEALRQRTHDPEVASLVNSINESVDALEGLFGELLDITRIDTGGVDVNPAPVPMRELFARLRLHFEPTAFEKGLALSFHGEQPRGLCRPGDAGAHPAQPGQQRHPLHRRRRRAGQLPAARRQAADAGVGQRHRHLRGDPAAHLRRVLPGAEPAAAAGAPAQGPGPGAGHRRAAGRRCWKRRSACARASATARCSLSRCRPARWCARWSRPCLGPGRRWA